MSTETETRLRAALHASADVITDETPEPMRAPASRRPVWWPLLAAAAVVLAVAALALVVRGDGGTKHRIPPIHHTSGPAPVLHRQACTVPLPDAWAQAVSTSTLPGLQALAVTDDGAVLAARVDRPDLMIVGRNGHARLLYAAPRSVPGLGNVRVTHVSVEGTWAAVLLGIDEGETAPDGIVAVNIKTGAVRTARSLLLGTLPIVQVPFVLSGVVYWSEGLSVGPDHVYAYDIARRHRRTLDTSRQPDILGPVALGGGIYWQKADRVVTYRAGDLPPGFDVLVGKGYAGLTTDGDRQAWVQQVGERFVVKMRVGNGAPVTVLGPMSDAPQVTELAGPYLLTGISVLDTRTGAATSLVSSNYPYTTSAGGSKTIAISRRESPTAAPQLSLLDIAKLPELHC